VRVVPHTDDAAHRRCTFEIVTKAKDHSPGTVKAGDALCPYPDCGRVIDGDEVKAQAQASGMGQQLYAVVYKRNEVVGYTKHSKPKLKSTLGFRAPRPGDDVEDRVREAFEARLPEWEARNVIPNEEVPRGYETTIRWPLDRYGFQRWSDFFSPRQFLGHCLSVEVFHELCTVSFTSGPTDATAGSPAATSGPVWPPWKSPGPTPRPGPGTTPGAAPGPRSWPGGGSSTPRSPTCAG
jgi:putative DNA methylase